jgi:hypothetical protein
MVMSVKYAQDCPGGDPTHTLHGDTVALLAPEPLLAPG